MSLEFPRETNETELFGTLTVDGSPFTTAAYEYAIVRSDADRPIQNTQWVAGFLHGGKPAYLVNGPALGRGSFSVYSRVGTVVVKAGTFTVT